MEFDPRRGKGIIEIRVKFKFELMFLNLDFVLNLDQLHLEYLIFGSRDFLEDDLNPRI